MCFGGSYKGRGGGGGGGVGIRGGEEGIRGGGVGIRGGGAGIWGGGVGIRGGGVGIRGGGAGIRGGGVGIRAGGAGIRGGGIQQQEYIMTFNEELNTIARNRYTYSFCRALPDSHLSLKCFFLLFNIEVDIIFITCVYNFLCCSDYQA